MPQGIAITFPTSPTEGQTYLAQNGFTYIYSAAKNQWKRGGEFVRPPKVLSITGFGPNSTYNIVDYVNPTGPVGLDSFKAYRYSDSYPTYSEIQVSISSAFSTIAYAATFTGTSHVIPDDSLIGLTTYYIRARQFVGPTASTASTGAISGYSQNPVRFITTDKYLNTPTIVSISATTSFPVYNIGYGVSTLPATVTYTGNGVGNLQRVDWEVIGPRTVSSSTGNTATAEIGIGTNSAVALANALVLAIPFSGAVGVGTTNDVNVAIRSATGASAGTTKVITSNGVTMVGLGTTNANYYSSAAYFGSPNYLTTPTGTDFSFGSGDFTIESWVYVQTTHGTLWSTSTSSNDWKDITTGYFNFNTSGSVNFRGASGGAGSQVDLNPSITTPYNSWNHVCAVKRSGSITVYLNGVVVGVKTDAGDVGNASSGVPGIGKWDNFSGGRGYFDGYLQDFRIYKGIAKYTESFIPPRPSYGTFSYATGTPSYRVGIASTTIYASTGDTPLAEVAIGSSTAAQVANTLVLAMPMNKTFGFQDINVSIRAATSGASAGTAKTVGLGTTSTANAPSHPFISATESKWYDGSGYFYKDEIDFLTVGSVSDWVQFSNGSDYTIETWFYPVSTPGGSQGSSNNHVIFNTNGAASAVVVGLIIGIKGDGSFRHFLGNASTSLDFTTHAGLVPIGSWSHIAITQRSKIIRIFVNGILEYTYDASAYSYSAGNPSVPLYIGKLSDNTWYSDGHFQDYKCYGGFAKYTSNFTPPVPICGLTTNFTIQTGFTTVTATGTTLLSTVGLGSTSSLAFDVYENQSYAGLTSITSSSGITTLSDPFANNLVLALPLSNIVGVGTSFTNDRNTQIRTISLVGGGTSKTITNSGIGTTAGFLKWYNNTATGFSRASANSISIADNVDLELGSSNFTIEWWLYLTNTTSQYEGIWSKPGNSDQNGMIFYKEVDGNINFYATTGGGSNWSISLNFGLCTLFANKWVHFAVTREGNQLRGYADGILKTTDIDSGSIIDNANPLFIGKYTQFPTAVTYGFDGYIQDFRFYKGISKYSRDFTPPPPMFGDYVRSTLPNKIVFTPGSDYEIRVKNTTGVTTSPYSLTRQFGTKPKGPFYDPFASNLVLALPMNNTTTLYDVTGQIKLETPTNGYSSGQTVTSPRGSTFTNKSITNTSVTFVTTQSKYYGYSGLFSTSLLTVTDNVDVRLSGVDWTIEFWARPDGNYTTYNTIVSKRVSTTEYEIGLNTGNGVLYYYSGGAVNGSSTVLTSNVWSHVAVTSTSGVIKFYVNGLLVYSVTETTNSGTNSLFIGNINGGSQPFKGYLQDVRIYKGLVKYKSNFFTPPNQIYAS